METLKLPDDFIAQINRAKETVRKRVGYRDVPEVYHISEKLPKAGVFVVCRYTGGNWVDRDQQGVIWKVARLKECGVEGNNLVPYRWTEWGPGGMFGQDVDLWFELPREVDERGMLLAKAGDGADEDLDNNVLS